MMSRQKMSQLLSRLPALGECRFSLNSRISAANAIVNPSFSRLVFALFPKKYNYSLNRRIRGCGPLAPRNKKRKCGGQLDARISSCW